MIYEKPTNENLFREAQNCMPGGVSSPVRAFKQIGGTPRFIRSGKGSKIRDVEGRSYIDYVLSYGPLLLGHAPPSVVRAIQATARRGTSFGAPTELETDLARWITTWIPAVESIRFVNSGTEATMSALRLARGVTGRDVFIKFDGGYHGHADAFLVQAGSGSATLGLPGSRGVPQDTVRHTWSFPYNQPEVIREAFANHPGKIAAVIVEPVLGNMGLILPQPSFLMILQECCQKDGALFILDEVMTGFRVSPGSCQQFFKLDPDLICLGKVIGGGLPVGAYGGKRKWMKQIAPEGDIYQAGTLSGNPLAMAAGVATLAAIKDEDAIARAESACRAIAEGFRDNLQRLGLPYPVVQFGSLFAFYFSEHPVRDAAAAKRSRSDLFQAYFHGMLEKGIHLAPSPYEAAFTSSAHTSQDVERTITAHYEVLSRIVVKT